LLGTALIVRHFYSSSKGKEHLNTGKGIKRAQVKKMLVLFDFFEENSDHDDSKKQPMKIIIFSSKKRNANNMIERDGIEPAMVQS
jgi:hypothetical protein